MPHRIYYAVFLICKNCDGEFTFLGKNEGAIKGGRGGKKKIFNWTFYYDRIDFWKFIYKFYL